MATKSTSPLTPEEVGAWEGLLYVFLAVTRELDERMPEEAGLTLRDYDVLATLEETPDHALRMSELAANMILSPSRVTRVVQTVERRGLVERSPDPDDARAVTVRLSRAGLQAFEAAQVIHHEVVRTRFLAQLSQREMRSLGAIWRRALRDSRFGALLEDHMETARHRT